MRKVKQNRSVLVLALLSAASPALAATFTVTNLTDGAAPGPAGSLRAAVTSANTTAGADTIDFQPGLTGTITLTSDQLTLTDTTGATTITGPGANVLTVSGNNTSRVFQINFNVTASISGLTIANGRTFNSDHGGAINTAGPLTLTGCTIRNSQAAGIAGAVYATAPLTIADCLFTGNQGALAATTISCSNQSSVVWTNTTFSGNTGSGSMIRHGDGTVRLESCTIAGNSSGVLAFNIGVVQYRNTIVAGNTGSQFSSGGFGTLTSLGHNICSDGTGNLIATGDLPNTDPLLGALADNGGPTQTRALLAGSPAINAGDPVTFPVGDQRGVSRPGGDACAGATAPDIGAFELAQSFKVTNLNDSGAGSLRQAVNDNNNTLGGGTICFEPGLTGTIVLTTGQLTLSRSVTITGPGANVLTVSGNNAGRVFLINAGVTAAISGLTIANGSTNAGGAGLYNQGTLTLTACTVRNNTDTSFNGGGGLWSDGGSSMTLTGCLFTANQSIFGSAIEQYSANQAVITNVTFSGNTTTGADAGIIEAYGGSIRLESCTVTGNTSGTGNAAAVDSYGGTVQYRNTIVSANTPNQFAANAGGTVTSLGHNISSDGTGNLTATGDLPNTDPLLGPLADNGGPTQTRALLPGSPAIDAGDPVTFPATDPRGVARPLAVLSCTRVPDIGAFELQPPDCNNNGIADACDIAAAHIYWSNDTSDLIQRAIAAPTNQSVQTVVSTGAGNIRGVAVDNVHAKVYWSDAGGNVLKQSNLDGSGVVTLVNAPNGDARDITLDIAGGRMYWANGDNASIYRSDLTGGGATALVTGQGTPSGIALDGAGGKMYWVNQTGNQIRRANLDGTNIETLISSGLTTPIDIALDIPGGKMYWAELSGSLRRANLNGTGIQDLVTTNLGSATSVALDLAAGKMYFSSSTLNKIERANLDGTSRENIVTGSGAIFRIAFIPQSADCDSNGVPDECQPDADADGVIDACDACSGFDDRVDTDGDGLPDACDNCPAVANGPLDPGPSVIDQISPQIQPGPGLSFAWQAFLSNADGELMQIDVGRLNGINTNPMLLDIYAGLNPGAPLIHQEVLNIPFVNPGEWSPIVLSTPVWVQAGQPYTFLIDGGLILMLGNYPIPGFGSNLGPNTPFAFQTYVRPWEQSDVDDDGVGDACDDCPDTPPGTPVGANGCETPSVVSAVSRRQHGGGGSYDVNLLTPLPGQAIAVEPCTGGPLSLVVTFDQPVQGYNSLDAADVSLSAGAVQSVALDLPTSTILTIGISGVPDQAALKVSLAGIESLSGAPVTDELCFGVLNGDVTGDAATNIFDLIATRNALNQAVTAGNFRTDVNADDAINIFDLIAIRNNLNRTCPTLCP